MIFLFAIYQQNKSVCLNWNKNIFRISNIFRVVCWFLFVLCSVYMVNLDDYLYLFETKPCTVTSKDNQREKKNYASDWGKQWKTVFVVFRYFRYFFNFTMFCFAFCSSSSSSFFFFFEEGGLNLLQPWYLIQSCTKSEKVFACVTFWVVTRRGCRNLT